MNNKNGYLTTGQVAEIVGSSPKIVQNWFDAGLLDGYVIPMSKDRRICHLSLIRFCQKHRMPIEGLQAIYRVLWIGDDETLAKQFRDIIPIGGDIHCMVSQNSFDAGRLLALNRFDVVIVDLSLIGKMGAVQIASSILTTEGYEPMAMIAIANEDESDFETLKKNGFELTFQKPIDPQTILDEMRKIELKYKPKYDIAKKKIDHSRSVKRARENAKTKTRTI